MLGGVPTGLVCFASTFGQDGAVFQDRGNALNAFAAAFDSHNASAAANPLAAGLRDLFRQHEHQINARTFRHALINEEEDAIAADVAGARLHFNSVALGIGELDLKRGLDSDALRLALLWGGFRHYASYIGAAAWQCQ